MKSKLGFGLITGVSIVMLLASCSSSVAPPVASKLKTYDISVQAKGNPKILDIDPIGNSKCNNPSGQPNGKFGCIDVGFGQQAVSTFRLRPASWHMTEMIICKGGTKGAQVCDLSIEEQKEFAVAIEGDLNRYPPDQDGLIKFSDIPGQISEFLFLDLNNIHTPAEYFYTLKACNSRTADDCAKTDPMIKNGGTQ